MHEDHNAATDDNTTRLYTGTLCDCRDHNCPAGAIPDLPCINEDTRGAPDNSPCEDHDCPTCYEHTIDWSDVAVTGPPSITDRIHRFLRRIIRMQ